MLMSINIHVILVICILELYVILFILIENDNESLGLLRGEEDGELLRDFEC